MPLLHSNIIEIYHACLFLHYMPKVNDKRVYINFTTHLISRIPFLHGKCGDLIIINRFSKTFQDGLLPSASTYPFIAEKKIQLVVVGLNLPCFNTTFIDQYKHKLLVRKAYIS